MDIIKLESINKYIINELSIFIDSLNLKKICCAIKADGNRCTQSIKSDNTKLCNKHKNCKNIKLIKERKNYQCIVYHNHLPNEENNNCPRCIISKTNYKILQ